jgi:hypothetical protein
MSFIHGSLPPDKRRSEKLGKTAAKTGKFGTKIPYGITIIGVRHSPACLIVVSGRRGMHGYERSAGKRSISGKSAADTPH